jgi:hypothetical protein
MRLKSPLSTVEELGKLVDARSANESAHWRDARIRLQLAPWFWRTPVGTGP